MGLIDSGDHLAGPAAVGGAAHGVAARLDRLHQVDRHQGVDLLARDLLLLGGIGDSLPRRPYPGGTADQVWWSTGHVGQWHKKRGLTSVQSDSESPSTRIIAGFGSEVACNSAGETELGGYIVTRDRS